MPCSMFSTRPPARAFAFYVGYPITIDGQRDNCTKVYLGTALAVCNSLPGLVKGKTRVVIVYWPVSGVAIFPSGFATDSIRTAKWGERAHCLAGCAGVGATSATRAARPFYTFGGKPDRITFRYPVKIIAVRWLGPNSAEVVAHARPWCAGMANVNNERILLTHVSRHEIKSGTLALISIGGASHVINLLGTRNLRYWKHQVGEGYCTS